MRTPEVEFLWWEGCPSTERALAELREALREVGLDHVEIRMREIRTDADADEAGFKGSPTILIDGTDMVGADTDADADADAAATAASAASAATTGLAERGGADDPVGLSCRVYRRRDGRISPTPDPDDVREALRRAATRLEVNR